MTSRKVKVGLFYLPIYDYALTKKLFSNHNDRNEYFFSDSTNELGFTLTHSHMNDKAPIGNVYKLGEFIKFSLAFDEAVTGLKGVIQKCWSTSHSKRNEYVLIKNR